MDRIIEEKDHFTKAYIEEANRLGRMLGVTSWCELDFDLCTREMLEDRLRRIAAVRKEISDKMLEEYHNQLNERAKHEASK
jgi:uncharacterized protein YllA (UPF0747 family)